MCLTKFLAGTAVLLIFYACTARGDCSSTAVSLNDLKERQKNIVTKITTLIGELGMGGYSNQQDIIAISSLFHIPQCGSHTSRVALDDVQRAIGHGVGAHQHFRQFNRDMQFVINNDMQALRELIQCNLDDDWREISNTAYWNTTVTPELELTFLHYLRQFLQSINFDCYFNKRSWQGESDQPWQRAARVPAKRREPSAVQPLWPLARPGFAPERAPIQYAPERAAASAPNARERALQYARRAAARLALEYPFVGGGGGDAAEEDESEEEAEQLEVGGEEAALWSLFRHQHIGVPVPDTPAWATHSSESPALRILQALLQERQEKRSGPSSRLTYPGLF